MSLLLLLLLLLVMLLLLLLLVVVIVITVAVVGQEDHARHGVQVQKIMLKRSDDAANQLPWIISSWTWWMGYGRSRVAVR